MKLFNFFAVLFFILSATASAQTGLESDTQYGRGEDSVKCLTAYTLFSEYAKQKNYEDAYDHWTYCFENCPAAGKGIYISGVSIVRWEIKNAKTKTEQNEKIDKLMRVYDQRIKYFGNDRKYPEAYILGKKALDMKRMKSDLPSQKLAYEWLKESIDKLGPNVTIEFLQHYMDLSFKFYGKDEITGERLIADYEMIQGKLDKSIARGGKYSDKAAKMKAGFEQNFASSGAADCETLERMFGDRLAASPNDEVLLQKIITLFDKTDCTDNATYYTAAEAMHKIAPTSGSAAGIAKMYLGRDDSPMAIQYFEEAITLEEDNTKKAQYLQTIAYIEYSKNNNNVKARKYALEAAKANTAWGDPYILIGKMYALSAQNQKLGKKDIENKAGYWAAIDMFNKAKRVDPACAEEANQNIKIYSNYFPTKEDIFFEEGYTAGQTVKVGGWIGTSTVVRSKD